MYAIRSYYDHPFVYLVLRFDEEYAAVLEVEERVGHRRTALHGDQRAVLAAFDRTGIRAELDEGVVHDPLAFRVGEELAAETDEPARRDLV